MQMDGVSIRRRGWIVRWVEMVPRARLERATYGLGNRCSVQLSYRGVESREMIG